MVRRRVGRRRRPRRQRAADLTLGGWTTGPVSPGRPAAFSCWGIVLPLQGVSGTIDHLARQPLMGAFLNFFNRAVIPRLDFLVGYEVCANLSLAVLGVVLVVAAERIEPS